MLNSICPIFPSQDFTVTRDFYESLGFRQGALYEKEGYLILVRDKIELHFYRATQAHDPAASDHMAFVRVADARALSDQFQQLGAPKEGIPRVGEAEDKPWGVCEFGVVDPDGTLLRIGHVLDD